MNLLPLPRLGLAATLLCFFSNTLLAQPAHAPRETALRFLQESPSKFGLTKSDVADVRVTDAFLSKHTGITHVWVQQQHQGIPVFNALFGLHVKPDGSVAHLSHRFVSDLAAKVNTTLPSLSAAKAVEMAFVNLGFSGFPAPSLRQKINERNFVFEGGAVSKAEIPVSACYTVLLDGSVRLSWTMMVEQANSNDVWNIHVDAQTGLIAKKFNLTVYCNAGHAHPVGDDIENCSEDNNQQSAINNQHSTISNQQIQAVESYNVFALPTESPAHGARELVTNPADPVASPYGWHDVNGVAGAEYTYTRGNNVFAFDDRDNNNQPPAIPAPNGGASLTFNYPYNPDNEPLNNLNAAITNLFYMVNKMHDISYRFGFDEQAGNFQENNYANGGLGGDPVQAKAIAGFTLASPLVNNADFIPTADGTDGQLRMFVWTRTGGKLLTVNAPGPVVGTYLASATSGWGTPVSTTPVTGDVAVADDGSGNPTWACNPLLNDLTGKIAIVDRQDCSFVEKALNAQNAGAIGCIICNYENETIILGAAMNSPSGQVQIPVIMLKKSDCDILRQYAGNGLNLSIVQPANPGPNNLDGDFDNGIIAHEYAHGISHRLTGGPGTMTCLSNPEQMGEGWSDFFTLVTSVKPGDAAAKRRGVGTYVLRQTNDGTGIRRNAYSTDMSINPVTFSWVAETPANDQVHPRGEIWASTLWDLYWAMVEKYGYDADLSNTNSGNFRAVQLVMDGMTYQPCDPGNIEGRDAIMLADILKYDGADTCLISSVFARRGMGYFASQGSPFVTTDGVENFDPIPTCIKELKIKKETSTPLIEPGEVAQFTITVTNHKDETADNVVVTDPLPSGLTFVSASNGGTLSNGMVTWNLGSMPSGQVVTLTYSAKSADLIGSNRYFRDLMESPDEWVSISNIPNGSAFALQSAVVKSGTKAWEGKTLPNAQRFSLETTQPFITVTGNKPVLRFWHQYSTEKSVDAGILEIQKFGEPAWSRIPPEKVFRNPYTGRVEYSTFAIAYLNGFSGNSNGWVQSYFDLSDYIGQDITFRFRLGNNTDAGTLPVGTWYIDEVEIMDILNYDTEACVTDNTGAEACAKAPARGVIVQPGILVGTDEPGSHSLPMQVQPNPANDFLHISLGQALDGQVQLQLIGADGRIVLNRTQNGLAEGQIVTLDVQQVPAGVYMVRLENNAGSSVRKVVIRK